MLTTTKTRTLTLIFCVHVYAWLVLATWQYVVNWLQSWPAVCLQPIFKEFFLMYLIELSILQRHMHHPSHRGCFLYRNATIIEQPINLPSLTSKLVMDAKAFIYNNQQNPFFLLFSLPQPHTPMFNRPEFKGKSRRGTCAF